MGRPLKILMIEDSASDAALNARALGAAGYEVSYELAATAGTMKAALDERTFDLVLSDHSLPQFDSPKALALLQESGRDIPFIAVSGAIGEEMAVALMKTGAQDYVMKGNLSRLAPAVERELRAAEARREKKRAEEALQESEERYRSLVESTDDPIYLVDRELRFLYANTTYLSRHGLTLETIAGLEYGKFHTAEKTEEFAQKIKSVIESDSPLTYEHTSEEFQRVFLRTLSPVRERHENQITKVTVISRDITGLKKAEAKLRALLAATIGVISATVEKRDPYTAGHQKRVADLARAIAREMGLSAERVDTIRTAGIIHDLGKIVVPAEILSKPTRLTEVEFSFIQIHCRQGYEILKDVEFSGPVARIVLEHHEKMDGSGYPAGLKGAEILLESRVLVVADVVEAMASHRPYRPALGIDKALAEIEGNRGLLYDPDVVDACLGLFREKRFAWEDKPE